MNIFNWTSQPEKLAAWNQQVKVVDKSGNQYWFKNGKLHRDGDKPAVINIKGYRDWYQNGKLHRLDGPAMESPNGEGWWFYLGRQVHVKTQEEFEHWVRYSNLK